VIGDRVIGDRELGDRELGDCLDRLAVLFPDV
jgi:hypothetical protein